MNTVEALVMALEQVSGQKRAYLLKAGRERFRGDLFNALIRRAREHLSTGARNQASVLLDLAVKVARKGVNEYAQAKMLFAIGVTWHDYGLSEEAIDAFRQAAKYFRQAGVSDGETRALARWGQALTNTGSFQAAIRLYHRALRQAKEQDNSKLPGQIANSLGNVYLKAGGFRRARSAFTKALSHAQSTDDLELACFVQGNLGLAEFELGHYRAAEAALREATHCARELKNRRLEASHVGSLGNALRAQGRLVEAEACFRQSLDLAREISEPQYEELALGNLGILLFHMGRMNEAIAYLEEARALSESIGEIAHTAEDAYHLGIAYREISAIQESKAAFQDSIRLAKAAFKTTIQSGAFQALANIAIIEEKWEQAKIYLETVDDLDEDETDPYNAAASPLAWGFLYYQQGDYKEAERYWTKAFELAEHADNIFIALTALVNRSAALTMLQHLTDAEELAREALRRAQAMGLPDDERVAWEGLGIILEQQRNFHGAWECYQKALDIIEIGRKELTAGTHRVGFFASRYGPYQRLVELFFHTDQPIEAWSASEQTRSRGFVDALSYTDLRAPDSLPSDLCKIERELLERLRGLQVQAAQARGRRLSYMLTKLAQGQTRLQELWEKMDKLVPEYITLRRGEPVTWQEIRSLLHVETAGG